MSDQIIKLSEVKTRQFINTLISYNHDQRGYKKIYVATTLTGEHALDARFHVEYDIFDIDNPGAGYVYMGNHSKLEDAIEVYNKIVI
jgi:hypothetical protein